MKRNDVDIENKEDHNIGNYPPDLTNLFCDYCDDYKTSLYLIKDRVACKSCVEKIFSKM